MDSICLCETWEWSMIRATAGPGSRAAGAEFYPGGSPVAMSETPNPAARAASTVPGNRPPTAVEEAEALAYDAGPEPPMAEEAFMPTCMVWVMFIGLGI